MSVVAERVGAALGVGVVSERHVEHGYTPAERLVLELADGRRVFAKAGTEELSSGWLYDEQRVYGTLRADFLPRMLAFLEGERPVLVLEDLSHALWPPPWSDSRVSAVRAALGEIAATPPPAGLPRLADFRGELSGAWARVEDDPVPFLSLRLCTSAWLDAALPPLRSAAERAELDGDALVHGDVRSDNICLLEGRTALVDWNHACVGNPAFDLASWLPSLQAEGGPAPEVVMPGCPPELSALMAGFFAARAGLPPPVTGPRVRDVQLSQLRTALPWAARALGLPEPR